jgi:hypothetical protein
MPQRIYASSSSEFSPGTNGRRDYSVEHFILVRVLSYTQMLHASSLLTVGTMGFEEHLKISSLIGFEVADSVMDLVHLQPSWPGRASTPTSESDHRRGKLGSRKGRIRAASLLEGGIKTGDHVRPTTSRGLNLGCWAARLVTGESRER